MILTFSAFTTLGVIDSEELLVNSLNGAHTLTGATPNWTLSLPGALTYMPYIDGGPDHGNAVEITVSALVALADGLYTVSLNSSNEGAGYLVFPGLSLDEPFAIDWEGNSPSATRLMSAGSGTLSDDDEDEPPIDPPEPGAGCPAYPDIFRIPTERLRGC